jgi:hypothetical protein
MQSRSDKTRLMAAAFAASVALFVASIGLCFALGEGLFEGLWIWAYYALGYAIIVLPLFLGPLSIVLGVRLALRVCRTTRSWPPAAPNAKGP